MACLCGIIHRLRSAPFSTVLMQKLYNLQMAILGGVVHCVKCALGTTISCVVQPLDAGKMTIFSFGVHRPACATFVTMGIQHPNHLQMLILRSTVNATQCQAILEFDVHPIN